MYDKFDDVDMQHKKSRDDHAKMNESNSNNLNNTSNSSKSKLFNHDHVKQRHKISKFKKKLRKIKQKQNFVSFMMIVNALKFSNVSNKTKSIKSTLIFFVHVLKFIIFEKFLFTNENMIDVEFETNLNSNELKKFVYAQKMKKKIVDQKRN